MEPTTQIVVVALLAAGVGLAIPVVVSFIMTLRQARETMASLEAHSHEALSRTAAVLEHLEDVSGRIAAHRPQLERLFASLEGLARTTDELQKTVASAHTASATIASALGAAIAAWRQSHRDDGRAGSAAGRPPTPPTYREGGRA